MAIAEKYQNIEHADIKAIRALGAEYRTATGLPLWLLGPSGDALLRLGDCGLCAKLSGPAEKDSVCSAYRVKAVEESMRWAEPYISVCPLGLVTFAVPIMRAGKPAAGLMSGFAILPQMERDIREDVLQKSRKLLPGTAAGAKPRLKFRVLPSEVLRRDAELLFSLTESHGVNGTEALKENRERKIQQLTIADYIRRAREENRDLVTSLVEMQNEIIEKVVLGDVNGSKEIINQFLGVIFLESGMSFDVLKVRLLELIVIISRAAIMKGISADGLLGTRYSYLTEVNAAVDFEDLFWKVTRVLENFTGTVSRELGRKTRARMTRMTDYIKKRFASKISAADVAASAGLSVGRALHLFRKESGMTLSAYVTRERIQYARYLLAESDASVGEIASECGFFDQSHFTRSFRAAEGASPLSYRKTARG